MIAYLADGGWWWSIGRLRWRSDGGPNPNWFSSTCPGAAAKDTGRRCTARCRASSPWDATASARRPCSFPSRCCGTADPGNKRGKNHFDEISKTHAGLLHSTSTVREKRFIDLYSSRSDEISFYFIIFPVPRIQQKKRRSTKMGISIPSCREPGRKSIFKDGRWNRQRARIVCILSRSSRFASYVKDGTRHAPKFLRNRGDNELTFYRASNCIHRGEEGRGEKNFVLAA